MMSQWIVANGRPTFEDSSMSSASVSTLSFPLTVPLGTTDFPAIERDRRDRRVEDWASTLGPSNPLEHWLVGRAASASLDLERLEQAEAEARQNQSVRGVHCWEIDRQIDVEELAIKLRKTPGTVSRKLRGSKQGAEWLLERWAWLLRTLDEGADWNDSQRTLALDLLGIPDAERDGLTPIDPPSDGGYDRIAARRAVAEIQSNALTQAIAGPLRIADHQEHRQASLGLASPRPGSALATIRREIAAATRKLRWALDTFHKARNKTIADLETPPGPDQGSETETDPGTDDEERNEPNSPPTEVSPTLPIATASATNPVPTRGNRRARRAQARILKRRQG